MSVGSMSVGVAHFMGVACQWGGGRLTLVLTWLMTSREIKPKVSSRGKHLCSNSTKAARLSA